MGNHQTSVVSDQIARVLRIAGVLVPILLAGYAVLVTYDIVPSSPLVVADQTLLLLATGLVAMSLLPLIFRGKDIVTMAGFTIWYHLLIGAFLLAVSGFASPVIFLWTMLTVVSSLLFGRLALYANIILLLSLLAVHAVITQEGYDHILRDGYWVLMTLSTGGLIASGLHKLDYDQRRVVQSNELVALQRSRTTTLINNLAEAIISTDGEGEIIVYNAAVLNLLDTNAELESARFDDVIQLRDDAGGKISFVEYLQSTSTVAVRDNVWTDVSGEPVRLEITTSPVRDTYHGESTAESETDGYIIILRDITKAKSLEEERDEFISVVSHELRTPITIAEGTLSNAQLMMQRTGVAKAKITESVNMAYDQVVFLARMVNDLSTLSRAERGVADTGEDIDIDAMIHDLYQEYQPQAAEKGLTLDLHMPGRIGTVFASRLYLKELLQNFITNAIKYTKEGSVTIDVRAHRDGSVVFTLKDTGIGISKADQKRIFEKFYRAEDYRTRETSGTGLGLYVAVKLARKLGTEIAVKSRLNHGSTFSITLKPHRHNDTTEQSDA